MTKIGLVLSGGGARAIAHLGILDGLDQIGLKPNVISGVSAGAIIARYIQQNILRNKY